MSFEEPLHIRNRLGHAIGRQAGEEGLPVTLAADAGATIFPLIPAFYNHPADADAMAHEFANRVLAHIGLAQPDAYRWQG